MSFYDLTKQQRSDLVADISNAIEKAFLQKDASGCMPYFSDDDTYIRRSAYLSVGRIYKARPALQKQILMGLTLLMNSDDYKVRQTAVNAAGEIGKWNFEIVQRFFDGGLKDAHHSVRNAVIGSVKKMGEVNSIPVLAWAATYLHHPEKEIRREICHGIELRGRTHPQDILPLLQQLEFDSTARVKNTLVHVLGQIAYKQGCLETVLQHLKQWKNQELVAKALDEIIDVHHRYRNFSFYMQAEAKQIIKKNFKKVRSKLA
ncbi:MAG: HEAT repeat domain-containing protein [Agriterribacter sp.]